MVRSTCKVCPDYHSVLTESCSSPKDGVAECLEKLNEWISDCYNFTLDREDLLPKVQIHQPMDYHEPATDSNIISMYLMEISRLPNQPKVVCFFYRMNMLPKLLAEPVPILANCFK